MVVYIASYLNIYIINIIQYYKNITQDYNQSIQEVESVFEVQQPLAGNISINFQKLFMQDALIK